MQNHTDNSHDPETPPPGNGRGPFGRGVAAIKSAWDARAHGDHCSERCTRTLAHRIPFGVATVGAAAALMVTGVTAAVAVPLSSPAPQQTQGPPPAAAQHAPRDHEGAGDQEKPETGVGGPEKSMREKIVNSARAEIGTKETGENCQKYSPQCVSWCALFALSHWEKAGVQVDNEQFAFTGNVYQAGKEKGTAFEKEQLGTAKPGDVLLFGTGPSSPSTSKHIGVVEKVSGDKVTTIEGNADDQVQRKEHKLSPDTFYAGVRPW